MNTRINDISTVRLTVQLLLPIMGLKFIITSRGV